MFLNAVLLFVVLFYVYPLRFLTTALVGRPACSHQRRSGHQRDATAAADDCCTASASSLIFTTFVLLHRHAWRQRAALDLTRIEELQLQYRARSHGISAGIAVVVAAARVALVPAQSMWAGLIYCLMGPLHGWNGYRGRRARSRDSSGR